MKNKIPLIIGAVIFFCICLLCVSFMIFVNWSNSDEGQATFREVETREAATAAAEATIQTSANATATATWATINERIKNAQVVFEDSLEEGSPFIDANIKDKSIRFEKDSAVISLPWDGFSVWSINQTLTDFIAEMDCSNGSDSISCGFAYSLQHKDGKSYYYASTLSGTYNCGFFDFTADFTHSNILGCDYPRNKSSFLQHIRLEKFGANIRFFVNDKLAEQRTIEKQDFLSGEFGLVFGRAGGEQSDPNRVYISNLKVWKLP